MMTFTQLDRFAQALAPEVKPGAVRAKLQEMQRRGYPFGVNTAAVGRVRVRYDIDMAIQMGIGLTLALTGMSVAQAVAIARQGTVEIRECYAEACSVHLHLPEIAPEPARLISIQYDHRTQPIARFDIVRDGTLGARPVISLSAIVIDVGRIVAELVNAVDGELAAELTDQARHVQRLVLAQRHDGDRLVFSGEGH